jgi:hypothetical protein
MTMSRIPIAANPRYPYPSPAEGRNGMSNPKMSNPDDEARAHEAKAILDRVNREQEGVLTSSMARASDHFGARDADPDDKIEVWGRRIGRGLSLVGVIVLGWLLGQQLKLW